MRKIKKIFKKIFCLSLKFFLLTGSFVFAAKNKLPVMPEWVNTPASVYPSEKYITYVGYSQDRNSAEIKALQGIASVFGQSVKSSALSSQRMVQAKQDGKIATANTSGFSQDILRTVDVDCLVGVEAKEFWFDENSTWYCLAVLEKDKAAEIYADMIKKNFNTISTLIKNFSDDENSLDGYAVLDFAEDIASENENHLKKVSVIKNELVSSLKSLCPSSKQIHAKKMEVAKNIPICVIVNNDEDGRFSAAFSEGIASVGFLGTYNSSARYILYAEINFERSDTTDGKTTRCRFNVSSYILDSETSLQIVPFSLSGREGHVDYAEAKNRAVKSVESKIRKEFPKNLLEYLKNIAVE